MGMKKEKAILILDPAPDCCWSCPMLGCKTKDKFICMITEDHCYDVAEERQINCPLKIFE